MTKEEAKLIADLEGVDYFLAKWALGRLAAGATVEAIKGQLKRAMLVAEPMREKQA